MERTKSQRDKENLNIAIESLDRAVRKWAFYFDRMDSEELDEINAAFDIIAYLRKYQIETLQKEMDALDEKLVAYRNAETFLKEMNDLNEKLDAYEK